VAEARRWVVRSSSLLLASALVAGFAVTAGAKTLLDAQVPFEFTAGSAKLPSGHYQVQPSTEPNEDVLVFRNVDTGKRTIVDYITRIAAQDHGQPSFVFDEVGGQHILSEIHLTSSDGYLLEGAGKTPHSHKRVKVG
jgi:hypothetical protein